MSGGVFLLRSLKGDFPDSGFLLKAAGAWLLSALLLLPAAALTLNALGATERALSMTSSLISFLSAAFAGAAAARKRRSGSVYTALLSAAVLVTALLTVGFLIAGESIDPSAVLSLVSFSFAGCLVGAVLCYRPVNKRRKPGPRA